MIISRRATLAGAAASIAAPAIAATRHDRTLFRRSIIFDGNLGFAPLFEGLRIEPARWVEIRASGLTAYKQTLGGSGLDFADTVAELNLLVAGIARNRDRFTIVERSDCISRAKRLGKVGIVLSFEAATMLEGKLENIARFAARNVRVMGLSYNLGSPFGGGALQPSGGLTSLGVQAVECMNAEGVTIDLSHSNDPTGLQATAASARPVTITHAGSAAVHAHPRNKSDLLLRAVAAGGGVIGIFDLSYLGDYPAYPRLSTFMRHLVHALAVCGEDHVGIGSDIDLVREDTSKAALVEADRIEASRRSQGIAAPEELPLHIVRGLEGPDRWQVVADELARYGFGSRATEKVLGANFVRVFRETWPSNGEGRHPEGSPGLPANGVSVGKRSPPIAG